MIDILKYITSDFWIFIGTVILISVIGDLINTFFKNFLEFVYKMIKN